MEISEYAQILKQENEVNAKAKILIEQEQQTLKQKKIENNQWLNRMIQQQEATQKKKEQEKINQMELEA
jgi:hypothetical protein